MRNCTPNWFRFGQQQDSSEFFVYFMDNLNEQLKSISMLSAASDPPTPLSVSNLVNENFGIRLTTRIECSKCNTTTNRTDTSFSLPLSFVSSDKPLSLQTLVNNYFHTEQLSTENGNSYSCESCESLQNAIKKIFVEPEVPNYLVLTLNR